MGKTKQLQKMISTDDDSLSILYLISEIREAVGDPTGKLMQDELVEHCRSTYDEVRRLRKGIEDLLEENAHLADGEDCTLIGLKKLIRP